MYTVNYCDAQGTEHTIEAESLRELSEALAEAGYDGPSLRVVTEQGFAKGWVSATDYRSA